MYTYTRVYIYIYIFTRIETYAHIQVCAHMHKILPRREKAAM